MGRHCAFIYLNGIIMKTENEHKDHPPGQHTLITIVVNGRPKEVVERELTFLAVVRLAFGNATINETTVYTVTFKRGHGNKPEGSLVDGETVRLKEGMLFFVTATDKS